MERAKQLIGTVKAAVNAEREIERCPHCSPLLEEIKACALNGHIYRKNPPE